MAQKIPIRASENPISGEMTTMVRFDEGGVNLPNKVQKRMREIDNQDLSRFSEGEVIEEVKIPGANGGNGGGIPGMDGNGLF